MPTWILVCICLLGALFAVKLVYLAAAGLALPVTHGALFIPTPSIRIKTFLDSVPMTAHDLFVDLGCGDGRVLRAAQNRYNVRGLGFEVNPLAYFMAKIMSFGTYGIQIKWGDFSSEDLSHADVVFCYLFPDIMERLANKLRSELRHGSRVVSCNFPLPGWYPEEILCPDSARHGDPIYLYRLPDSCRSPGMRNR